MQRFDAVNPGQLNVHQNERRVSLVSEAHALFTRLGLDGLIPLALDRDPRDFNVFGFFSNKENELSPQAPRVSKTGTPTPPPPASPPRPPRREAPQTSGTR